MEPSADSRIVAALGPTNTGKTHRALARLREHPTGAIGVPLRLLARELYDRLTAELGENQVALLTGEEKRIPNAPRYWICTVEAMPPNLEVDFLAIDEIQLCTHRERGHVFTERLLHARGRVETWFMGSTNMTQLVRQLVPEAEIRGFPRLSQLRAAGSYTLGSLGRRSAVVCFSIPRVYEMAERLRARRGGAAVVLGALSPRARNAQVALYESGEVDYLVATDAIGMGLNLDLDRVAFADTRKFDGLEYRPLELVELSQIAGRAGRYQRDGEFGVLAPEPRLAPSLERLVERHQLPAELRVSWRNHELDFSSLAALLASLEVRPPRPELVLAPLADDAVTLRHLARRPAVEARVDRAERVELLWETCRIPDYRKLSLEGHANLVEELFWELCERGVLSAEFLEPRLRRLERGESDIETLTQRIAFTRTWTFVAFRDGWVESPGALRARLSELEDRLSDALHAALVARFVEKRKTTRGPRPAAVPDARPAPFAALEALKRRLEGGPEGATEAPRRTPREEAVDAAHERFTLGPDLKIRFEGWELARVVRGRRLAEPEPRLLPSDEGAGLERQLIRRLRAFLRDWVDASWGPLGATERRGAFDLEPSAAARGLLYRLEESLGATWAAEAEPLVAALSEAERRAFERLGVVFGRATLHVRSLLKPRALERRELLWRAFTGLPRPGSWRGPTHASFALTAGPPPPELLALGFVALGPRAVRLDIVEKMLASSAGAPAEDERRRVALAGASKSEGARVLRALARLAPEPARPPSLGSPAR